MFEKIIGHSARLKELSGDLEGGNLSHAYLFSGPANVGKFTIARMMSRALHCPQKGCGECAICSEIEKGIYADTIEVADNGESIKISEIREILNKVNLTKQGKYKTVLIKNIERMGQEAANALLKTLEDPPPEVIFLLTSSQVKEILPTIISRVRHLKFGALRREELVDFLRGAYPLEESAKVEVAAEFAEGKAGKALLFMEQPEALEEYKEMFNTLREFLVKPDLVEQFRYVNDLIKNAKEGKELATRAVEMRTSRVEEKKGVLENFLETFLIVLRKEMLGAAGSGVTGGANPKAGAQKSGLALRAARGIKETQKARALLKNNINTKLLLENLMLALNE